MRKLSEMIVLIRGGGAVGSAVAQRLVHSHFRVCITETEAPTTMRRGVSLSEAVYENQKTVEDISAEKVQPNLEQIYKVWRNDKIPVVADPEMSVRPLLKPDVLVNAMMLKRETNSRMKDAPLVIGIGPGFTAGGDVHLVVDSNPGRGLGKVIIDGSVETDPETEESDAASENAETVIKAEDNGIFTTDLKVGDSVKAGDVIGHLDEREVAAPVGGVVSGIIRNEVKVLANTRLVAVDSRGTKESCQEINDYTRAIAGGVLEAILLSLNVPDDDSQD